MGVVIVLVSARPDALASGMYAPGLKLVVVTEVWAETFGSPTRANASRHNARGPRAKGCGLSADPAMCRGPRSTPGTRNPPCGAFFWSIAIVACLVFIHF